MLVRNRSGQFVYFGLVSAISGNSVTGGAAAISGRMSLDGAAQAVVNGPIGEVGGGQYKFGAYAADTDGACIGYLFTASGCVPVNVSVVTTGNVSGNLFPNSGLQVGLLSGQVAQVYSGNLSGQLVTAASGAFGTASLNSGQPVLVYSGQLSGQLVNLLSGNQTQVWSGTFVNVFSGQLSGQLVTAASGVFGTASLNSGQSVLVYSGQLSGQLVNLLSGNLVSVVSGTQVNTFSGQVFPNSGFTFPLLSGDLFRIATVLLDLSGSIEGGASGITLREATRLNTAALAGEISGAGTGTIYIKNAADTKIRITATIDSSGNRTSLALDPT